MAWGYMRAQGGGGGSLCGMMVIATSSNGWSKSGYADGVTFSYDGGTASNSLTCKKNGKYRILTRNVYASAGHIILVINGESKTDANSDVEVQLYAGDVLSFEQSWHGTGHNLACVVIEKEA